MHLRAIAAICCPYTAVGIVFSKATIFTVNSPAVKKKDATAFSRGIFFIKYELNYLTKVTLPDFSIELPLEHTPLTTYTYVDTSAAFP